MGLLFIPSKVYFNVYTTDPETRHRVRVGEELKLHEAVELKHSYEKSSPYAPTCDIVSVDNDPDYSKESDE